MNERSSLLDSIDVSLMLMRRLWAPPTSGRPAAGAGSSVDLSTVLVVHAVAELGAPSVAQVADRLGVVPATASRLCERAVAADVVARSASTRDARRSALTLTAAGTLLHRQAQEFRRDYLAGILADWSSEEIADFDALLMRFAAAVHADPPSRSA